MVVTITLLSFLQYKIQRDFLAALMTVVCISLYYAFLVSDHMTVTSQLGIICNICTILFFASPLLTMVTSLTRVSYRIF